MKYLFFIFYLIISYSSIAQIDSAKEKEPHYLYITGGFNAATNTIGTFQKRISPSIEVGSTFGIFDIGLSVGRLGIVRSDTSFFFEIRPTINVFSKGRFAEGLCLGAGYRLNSTQGFMTEICNSINFNISNYFSVALVQGYYFFDGKFSNSAAQFMGINLTCNLLKKNGTNDKLSLLLLSTYTLKFLNIQLSTI